MAKQKNQKATTTVAEKEDVVREPELKPVTVQQIAAEIAADVKGLRPVRNKCLVCGVEYDANMITLNGKDTGKITPPRCPKHQTKHLTDLRVTKHQNDVRLLKNLRGRLTAAQRQQVLEDVSNTIMDLANAYNGVSQQASGFNLEI